MIFHKKMITILKLILVPKNTKQSINTVENFLSGIDPLSVLLQIKVISLFKVILLLLNPLILSF